MFGYYAEYTNQINSSFLEYPPVSSRNLVCFGPLTRSYEVPWASLIVCPELLSGTIFRECLFLRQVRKSSNLKVTTGLFEQNLFLSILGQTGPKLGFSSFIKNQRFEFFRFLHEVTATSRLKIHLNDY